MSHPYAQFLLINEHISFSVSNGYQTAIDKVKQNEALTHPKRSEEQQKVSSVTELNKKGRHMSIITVAEDKSKDKGGSSLSSGRVKNDYFYEVKNDDFYEMSLLLLMTFSTSPLLLNIH